MSETRIESEATVTVEVRLTGRAATLGDVQQALDVMTGEGIPAATEVETWQREERVHEEGVPYADQQREHRFTIRATRPAKATR